jgi:hypothetical protein
MREADWSKVLGWPVETKATEVAGENKVTSQLDIKPKN